MAGRRTFFSFHYQNDISRACVVRNAGMVDAAAAAGWKDASLWEETKRKGDDAIRRLIDDGLYGTSVTVVLIGAYTAQRRWVGYEISQSVVRGNGLLGIRIHNIPNFQGKCDPMGLTPQALTAARAEIYDWDPKQLGTWVERAAIKAGHPCLQHGRKGCLECQ